MSNLLTEQQTLLARITRSYTNFKKDGTAKMTLSNCKTRMDNLEKIWFKYEANHSKLLNDNSDEVSKSDYFKQDEFAIAEEIYLDKRSEFQTFLDTNNGTHLAGTNTQKVNNFEDQDRLPAIALPKFKGEFCEWESFRDLFTTLVINKSNISNVTKLHHLKLSLEGDAARLVSSYAVTEENFIIAWQKLKDRYENKRRLVSAHLFSVFSIKPMKGESSREIKRIISSISSPLAALESLKRPVSTWDDVLVYHIVSLLDSETRKQWEKQLGNYSNPFEPPTFKCLINFLENQITVLEALEDSLIKVAQKTSINTNYTPKSFKLNTNNSAKSFHVKCNQNKCPLCSQPHFFMYCELYKRKTPPQRKDFIISQNRCFNCLASHNVKSCNSKKRCFTCHGKHHSSIHINNKSETSEVHKSEVAKSLVNEPSVSGYNASLNLCMSTDHVLLSTAMVRVCSDNDNVTFARALIDQGSQTSFISESLCQRVNLKYNPVDVSISGVGGLKTFTCRKSVQFVLRARFHSDFYCIVHAYVIPKITSYAPNAQNKTTNLPFLKSLDLADPHFAHNGKIELLLGASIHAKIIEGEIIHGEANEPIAMKSALGWIVSGSVSTLRDNNSPAVLLLTHDEEPLDAMLYKFFAQEEFATEVEYLTPDEIENENIFKNGCARDEMGRYTVKLPLKEQNENSLVFPGIKDIARRMFNRMEKKFESDGDFGHLYREFMREYIESGHMVEINDEDASGICYVLPHHGILKKSSHTTELRTVFNGSAKASNGLSINDFLYTGKNLLPDLSELILRWRKYKYVFVSDIKQMFRQIKIHQEDQRFQTILWRCNTDEPVKLWKLQTVTYGMVSSPFLAIRVTRQLATDEIQTYPLGADILNNETYMDDTLSGGHTLKEALDKKQQLIDICGRGGFQLHKWLSNNHNLSTSIPHSDHARCQLYEFGSNTTFNVLGLIWNPELDIFFFGVENNFECENIDLTKRKILSRIAKLFDPLGWLAPVIITAKIFMQKLWIKGISWDEPLSSDLTDQWLSWYNDLNYLKNVRIRRWLGYDPNADRFELHGFADASKFAYGAVVYLRVIYGEHVQVALLQAKTKVAPIKPLLTIPRLELCAAMLLAKLASKLLKAIDIENVSLHLWSDSTDVLFWLKDHPSRWPIFIANRCSKIQTLVSSACWRHVRSGDTPADCLSRGVRPSDLSNFQLWLRGPQWLSDRSKSFEESQKIHGDNFTMTSSILTVQSAMQEGDKFNNWDLLVRYSSLQKLIRVTSFILKFVNILLLRTKLRHKIKLFSCNWYCNVNDTYSKELTYQELIRSRLLWVYLIQRYHFCTEIKSLSKNFKLPASSALIKLDPFMHDNLLRVGGRLQHSFLEFEEKHTLILPYASLFSSLLAKYFHQKTLHGGIKLTLSTLRGEFWIIKARQLVKNAINNCHSCLRYRRSTLYQKLGNLPEFRIRPCRPFLKSGVDYAGPFNIKASAGRGVKSYKGYIAVFICLSTRAVHLELVSSYASQEFIAAFRRFTSRRGHCSDLFSDRGTTFVGANKELKGLFEKSTPFIIEVKTTLITEGTNWHFNPPAAPHFGGIWEAAVKSAKYHLKRILSPHTPTFEEFYTLLTQVEACLNSRPLIAVNDDVGDIQPLTPAHFLINSPSYILPENYRSDSRITLVERWKLMQQMLAHWWKRWSREYLQTLQVRNKWQTKQPSLKLHDIVLITDENAPPAKWPLARVIQVHPSDDQVRVVKLRTTSGELTRPVTKLILLSKADSNAD